MPDPPDAKLTVPDSSRRTTQPALRSCCAARTQQAAREALDAANSPAMPSAVGPRKGMCAATSSSGSKNAGGEHVAGGVLELLGVGLVERCLPEILVRLLEVMAEFVKDGELAPAHRHGTGNIQRRRLRVRPVVPGNRTATSPGRRRRILRGDPDDEVGRRRQLGQGVSLNESSTPGLVSPRNRTIASACSATPCRRPPTITPPHRIGTDADSASRPATGPSRPCQAPLPPVSRAARAYTAYAACSRIPDSDVPDASATRSSRCPGPGMFGSFDNVDRKRSYSPQNVLGANTGPDLGQPFSLRQFQRVLAAQQLHGRRLRDAQHLPDLRNGQVEPADRSCGLSGHRQPGCGEQVGQIVSELRSNLHGWGEHPTRARAPAARQPAPACRSTHAQEQGSRRRPPW